MIQKTGVALRFYAFYVESKVGKTGLTVTADIYENGSAIVTGGAATEIGGGLYSYTLAAGSNDANGEYAAVFKTATTTVDQQWLPALWTTPAWLTALDTATVTFVNPVSADGQTLTLVRGDDYSASDSRSLDWTVSGYPDLSGATINFSLRVSRTATTSTPALTVAGSVLSSTSVRVQLTAAQTEDLSVGNPAYIFDVQATLAVSGRKVTIVRGDCIVLEDATI